MPGGITVSPWVYRCVDKANVALVVSFAFNTSTRALTSCTVTRASVACVYAALWLGKGGDGKPNSTTHAFALSSTSTTITAASMATNGLSTIDDVLALQITCG